MSKTVFEDKRILEALDYIDDKYISEITKDYEVLESPEGYVRDTRRLRKAYIKALAAAACLVLITGLAMNTQRIIDRLGVYFPSFGGSGTVQSENLKLDLKVNASSSPVELNEEEIDLIMGSFIAGKDEAFYNYNYKLECYWKENGVFAVNISDDDKKEGGIDASFTNGVKFCSSSVMCNLSRAYDSGMIDDSAIDSFVEAYNKYLGNHFGETPVINLDLNEYPASLSKAEQYEIVYAYIFNNSKNSSILKIAQKGCSIRCSSKKGGVYIFFFDYVGQVFGNAITHVSTPSGYKFAFPDTRVPMVYHDGLIYSLYDADVAGLLEILFSDPVKLDLKVNASSSPVELNEEEIDLIMGSFISGKDEAFHNYNYKLDCYWKENGVFAVNISDDDKKEGGIDASFTNGVKFCSSSVMCNLSRAYDSEMIDDSALDSFVEAYNRNYEFAPKIYFDTTVFSNAIPPVKLNKAEVYEIVYAYLNNHPEYLKNIKYGCAVRCMSEKEGAYFMFFDIAGKGYFQAITTVTTPGGYKFTFNDSHVAIVYHDGLIYSLEEADTAGLLEVLFGKKN